jgi:cell division transport system permease protein
VSATGRSRLRQAVLVARNAVELVVGDAARNWARNRRTVTPAVGSMCVLLVLSGISVLGVVAVRNVLAVSAADASVIRVYLREGTTDAQVQRLEARMKADRRVASASYVSPEEALREAKQRPGLAQLVSQAGGNPFPASLDITVRRLTDAGSVVTGLTGEPAIDTAFPSSYDAGAYQQLQGFITVAGAIALGVLLVLGAVAAAVTANAIRAAILARRDDVAIMRLVGASGWMVRGPFVFEGTLTGVAAGLLSAGVLVGLFAGAQAASARTFTEVLPGVGWPIALTCAGLLPVTGMVLGSAASLAGLRGLRG